VGVTLQIIFSFCLRLFPVCTFAFVFCVCFARQMSFLYVYMGVILQIVLSFIFLSPSFFSFVLEFCICFVSRVFFAFVLKYCLLEHHFPCGYICYGFCCWTCWFVLVAIRCLDWCMVNPIESLYLTGGDSKTWTCVFLFFCFCFIQASFTGNFDPTTGDDRGIIPRTIEYLFPEIEKMYVYSYRSCLSCGCLVLRLRLSCLVLSCRVVSCRAESCRVLCLCD
jgi:hypothetical protein